MSTKKIIILFSISLLAFFIWSLLVYFGYFNSVDQAVYENARLLVNTPWLTFCYAVTVLGNLETLFLFTALLAAFLFFKKLKKESIWIVLQMLLVLKMSSWFKLFFVRVRPIGFMPDYFVRSFSYPSGHALGALVFYSLVFYSLTQLFPKYQNRKFFMGTGLLIFLVGASRVFLGVHWASDVVGGWILGTAFILANFLLARRLNFFPKIIGLPRAHAQSQ